MFYGTNKNASISQILPYYINKKASISQILLYNSNKKASFSQILSYDTKFVFRVNRPIAVHSTFEASN
jgi:predicted nucleic-acid-binding protein